MTQLEKYENAFIECLKVEKNQLESLVFQDVAGWDSVGHMSLISKLERTFEIMIDINDIIDFSSFEKGKEILKNYDVVLN